MTEARAGRLRPIGHAEKTLRLMLGSTVAFGAGSAAGMMVRNWIENPPEIPAIASAPTGPLAKDLVAPDPGITVFAEPTPSQVLMADSNPPPPLIPESPSRPLTSTPTEPKPTATPLREMVVIGNVDVFLGPGDRKVGYFIPGQRFTPTGITSGDYIQVSDGRNTIWVKNGGSYQAVEIPQVASRPPAQEPSQDTPTARPPTQPETAPTATRVPEVKQAPPPVAETARSFPKEMSSVEGLIVHNMGTKYGIDISDGGFKDSNGNYCPSRTLGCEALIGFNNSEMKENNQRYLQGMFAKYRSRPEGGKGLEFRMFFYDSVADYPFPGKGYFKPEDFYYRYARQVGNTIEYHLGVNGNFNFYNNQQRTRISYEINNFGLANFLSGNHDLMINFVYPAKPMPAELSALGYPQKLMVTR